MLLPESVALLILISVLYLAGTIGLLYAVILYVARRTTRAEGARARPPLPPAPEPVAPRVLREAEEIVRRIGIP